VDERVGDRKVFHSRFHALSGGGIWVPAHPRSAGGLTCLPEGVVEYLRQITDGLVQRRANYGSTSSHRENAGASEGLSGWLEFVWKPRLCRLLPRTAPAAPTRSTINVATDRPAQAGRRQQKLLAPLALAPKGIWWVPRTFDPSTGSGSSWRASGVLLKLIGECQGRVFGERMAAIGQSLAARCGWRCGSTTFRLAGHAMTELLISSRRIGDRCACG